MNVNWTFISLNTSRHTLHLTQWQVGNRLQRGYLNDVQQYHLIIFSLYHIFHISYKPEIISCVRILWYNGKVNPTLKTSMHIYTELPMGQNSMVWKSDPHLIPTNKHIIQKSKFYSMEMWPHPVKPDIISYGSEFYGMEKWTPPSKQAILDRSQNSIAWNCGPTPVEYMLIYRHVYIHRAGKVYNKYIYNIYHNVSFKCKWVICYPVIRYTFQALERFEQLSHKMHTSWNIDNLYKLSKRLGLGHFFHKGGGGRFLY